MVFHWSSSDFKSSLVSRTLSILADLNNSVVCMVSTCPLISKSSNPCTSPLVTVPTRQLQLQLLLLLLLSLSPQFSRTLLSFLADRNNAVVWMVSVCPLISKSTSPCTNPLVTVLSASITVSIIVTFMFHHHHHVVPPARTSLTLSRHVSLSFIASGRSSGLHPVSSQSCCMYCSSWTSCFCSAICGGTSLMSSVFFSSLVRIIIMWPDVRLTTQYIYIYIYI